MLMFFCVADVALLCITLCYSLLWKKDIKIIVIFYYSVLINLFFCFVFALIGKSIGQERTVFKENIAKMMDMAAAATPNGPGPSTLIPTSPRLVKEGLLFKRGETIRNWRPRYFYLFEDGSFLGFKSPVENPLATEPFNNFTVRGCQIMKMDRPKAYTFMVRGLAPNRILERSFCTESEKERQDWVNSIETVAQAVGPAPQGNKDTK